MVDPEHGGNTWGSGERGRWGPPHWRWQRCILLLFYSILNIAMAAWSTMILSTLALFICDAGYVFFAFCDWHDYFNGSCDSHGIMPAHTAAHRGHGHSSHQAYGPTNGGPAQMIAFLHSLPPMDVTA